MSQAISRGGRIDEVRKGEVYVEMLFFEGDLCDEPISITTLFLCKFEVRLQICISFLRKKFLYHEKLCKFVVSPQNYIKWKGLILSERWKKPFWK